jgi:outer membrane protein assembly factor BamB
MRRERPLALVMALLLGASALAQRAAPDPARQWPTWRGPSRDGVSGETDLPVKWSATEGVDWTLPLPAYSGSTPIVWGDLVFLNVATAPSSGQLELWALDRARKNIAWKRPLAAGNHAERKQNMSSPSPVTDGRHVWAMTGVGVLKAFDLDGREVWTRDIQKDYGRFGLNWGYASSPLVDGDALYAQVLHGMKTDDPSYLLRLDALTGKTVWRVVRPTGALQESPDAYTTPVLLRRSGRTEVIVTGGNVVTSHDPATGREIWRADVLNPTNDRNYRIVASPVIAGGLVIAPSRNNPLVALRPAGPADAAPPRVAWRFERGPDVPTPVSDGPTYMCWSTPACSTASISRAARSSTARAGCRTPTARRPCSPAAGSTSRARTRA